MPDETLCMAAMRFVYSRPFVSTTIAGMFEERLFDDNYKALARYQEMGGDEHAALSAAREVARMLDAQWLPKHYRWLEERWRG
jgi:predicted aldo/keto reductase-like oxidoreductase